MRVRMKTMKVSAVAAVVCLAFPGCDQIEQIMKRKEQERSLAVETPAQVREETTLPKPPPKNESAVLLHYVETKLRLVGSESAACNAEIADLREDRVKLSARIGAVTDAALKDKNGSGASRLLLLLKDGEVNALALKYLANDFAAIRSEFAEKVRVAQQNEQRYRAELSRNQAESEKRIADSRKKVEQEYRRNVAEANRLRREIEGAEKKLRNLQTSAPPGGQTYDQQRRIHQQNVRHQEHDLARMKLNLDRLESILRTSAAQRTVEQTRAESVRDRRVEDEKVAKAAKSLVPVDAIVEEYRARTINRLDETLHARRQDADRRQKRMASKILHLESVTNGLEKLNSQALAAVRADIDRQLARMEEDGTKGKADGRGR